MAITGKFQADFSNFYDAVQQAEVKLRSFETGANKVEGSLNRMVDSFSGRKVISEATLMAAAIEKVGGPSTLTASELQKVGARAAEAAEKMRALGMEVPRNVQALADLSAKAQPAAQNTSMLSGAFTTLTASFTAAALITKSVTALVSWGTEAFASAAQVADLADKTGLSTDAIQRMSHVASQTGSSVEAFTDASFKLSARLAGGSGSVRSALDDLGLSLSNLRGMDPAEQFDEVTAALGGVADSGERSRLGILLFGKSFGEIAGAVSSGYKEMASGAVLMSEETVRAADRFDDGWSKVTATIKALIAETASFTAAPFIDAARYVGLMGEEAAQAGPDIRLFAEETTNWADRLAAANVAADSLTASELAQIEVARRLGATTEELTDDFNVNADTLRVLDERSKEASKSVAEHQSAARRLADAQAELRSAGDGWRGTLEGINDAVVQAVKGYLEAGVSQSALATVYELTATQVKSIATALAEEEKAHKAAEAAADKHAKTVEAAVDQMAGLWNDHNAAMLESNLSTHIVILSRIDEWKAKQIAAAMEAGLYTKEMHAQIAAAATERFERELVDMESIRKHSKTYLQEQAAEALATFEYVTAHSSEFTAAFIEQKRLEAEAARAAAENFGQSYTDAMDAVQAKSRETTSALTAGAQSVALTWSEAMSLVWQGRGQMIGTIVHQPVSTQPWGRRAQGGPAMSGLPYLVGEKGPEVFVPSSMGTVLPNGPGTMRAAGAFAPVIHISAGMGSNPQEIARLVKQALVEAARSRGQMFPVGV